MHYSITGIFFVQEIPFLTLLSFLLCLKKMLYGAIVRLFSIIRKKAGRNSAFLPVIVQALTAESCFIAGSIAAVAIFQIAFFIWAVHLVTPLFFSLTLSLGYQMYE